MIHCIIEKMNHSKQIWEFIFGYIQTVYTAHHIFLPQDVQGLVTLPFTCNCCELFYPILMEGLFCTLSWLYLFSLTICVHPWLAERSAMI